MAASERLAAAGVGQGSVLKERSWRPASRRELWLLGAYFAAVVAATDYANVRLGVELLSLCVFLAAVLISRMPARFLLDWWFVLIGMIMWNLSGAVASDSPFPWHLDFMLQLDRLIGLDHQPVQVLQSHLSTPGRLTWLDWITAAIYNMHLPEPFVAGYFLWRLNRAVYFQFAAAALVLLVLGLVTFIVFPAVPPWLAAYRLVRIHEQYLSAGDWQTLHGLGIAHPVQFVQTRGRVYLPGVRNLFGPVLAAHPLPFHGTPIFYLLKLQGDRVAAFPSEHAAFPVLELLFFRVVSKGAAIVLSLWVASVVFAVVYLGEHWITDVLAGWIFSLVIFGFVRWYANRRSQISLSAH